MVVLKFAAAEQAWRCYGEHTDAGNMACLKAYFHHVVSASRNTLRPAAMAPFGGHEIDEITTPLEAAFGSDKR